MIDVLKLFLILTTKINYTELKILPMERYRQVYLHCILKAKMKHITFLNILHLKNLLLSKRVMKQHLAQAIITILLKMV